MAIYLMNKSIRKASGNELSEYRQMIAEINAVISKFSHVEEYISTKFKKELQNEKKRVECEFEKRENNF